MAARYRWVSAGAVVAVLAGVGGVVASGASGSTTTAFVPISPCRLVDTRDTSTVGSRSTPLAEKETFTAAVVGTNGNCTIPNTATAVELNVTATRGTANSYLTVFPAGNRPGTSTVNWQAAQAPTSNSVSIALSSDGLNLWVTVTNRDSVAKLRP